MVAAPQSGFHRLGVPSGTSTASTSTGGDRNGPLTGTDSGLRRSMDDNWPSRRKGICITCGTIPADVTGTDSHIRQHQLGKPRPGRTEGLTVTILPRNGPWLLRAGLRPGVHPWAGVADGLLCPGVDDLDVPDGKEHRDGEPEDLEGGAEGGVVCLAMPRVKGRWTASEPQAMTASAAVLGGARTRDLIRSSMAIRSIRSRPGRPGRLATGRRPWTRPTGGSRPPGPPPYGRYQARTRYGGHVPAARCGP
jgi:hypothetical protein